MRPVGTFGAPPGATLPATVAVAGVGPAEVVEVPIPVLDGTLPAYARYLRAH
ncbi:hypothetical protein [Georgenia sp. AZ-5]|uniref:hypothetical protein n=1 Tax=Georgenia sp. AZ-5 TaxID=3367526 RepID=UPI003753FDF5